ncbi:MAG TPA: hypothetical protein VFS76_13385 [Pyrinomonadaceae bacterium]|nr:hypothetical protein [Pyrinomonadaceae bacterium]
MKLHKIIYAGLLSLFLGLPFAAQESTDPQSRFKSKEIGVITTLAGGGRAPFSAAARNAAETIIEGASGIATDRNGNLYVAGFLAHRVFKIDKGGAVSLFAGTGEAATSGDGGPATDAAINGPSAVATDGDVVYIAEQLGDRIRRVDAQGIITTYGGGGKRGTPVSEGARAEGAALEQPAGLFVRKSELYFTEFAGNYVRRIDREGRLRRVAGTGQRSSTGDGGSALKATLQGPTGITGDARGRIYVSEVFSARVRAIDEKGKISTFSGLGKPGGRYEGVNARNANLRMPHGLAMDGRGNLYIGDFAGNRIYIVNRNIIRTFAGTGQGELPLRGSRTSVSVESPLGLTVDSSGDLLVATYTPGSVLRINPRGAVTHVAGEFPQTPASFDSARDAFFKNVGGVTADRKGNIYMTEVYGNKVWSMNTRGGLRLLTGSGVARSQGDKRAAQTADVNHPVGVVAAENGLFVIEADGHRVRFVDNSGVIVTAVGTGVPGFSGDGNIGALAGCAHPHYGDTFGQYSYPADSIAKLLQSPSRDFSGNLLNHGLAPTSPQDKRPFFVFVDTDNNRVRKIDERGIITTVAGNGKSVTSGDRGPAIRAGLNRPEDVVVDSEGNLYISESHRVRKVDTRGVITTYAGTGRRGFSGSGGPATRADLDSPYGLALDGRDLYIADSWNNVVWKVDEKGIITLFAGNRQKSSMGDGDSALNASLNAPIDLAVQNTAQGTYLLIAELEGARLRAIKIR